MIPAFERLKNDFARTSVGRVFVVRRRLRRAAHVNPNLAGPGRALRWIIRSCAPVGPDGEVWGDAHFAEDLAAALRSSGVEATTRRFGQAAEGADVVVDLRGLYRQARVPGAVNVLWVISHPDLVDDDELRQYDVVFAAGRSWAEARTAAGAVRVEALLQATAPERFRPDAASDAPRSGVLFVGTTRGVYRRAVMWALESRVDVEIHGHGWGEFVDPRLVRTEHLANRDLPSAYAKAEIVLNDHWEDMRREGFISNRVLDAAASGAVVVTDDVNGIAEVSPSLVRVFDDRTSLAAAIAAPLPAEEARRTAAAQVADEHSFLRRAEVLRARVERELRPIRSRRLPLPYSRLTRTGRAARDLLRVNRMVLLDGDARRRVLAAVRAPAEHSRPLTLGSPELAQTTPRPAASPFVGLSEFSTSLSRLELETDAPPHLNLVIPELNPRAVFAGVKTALEFADGLAGRLALPVRVVLLKPPAHGEFGGNFAATLSQDYPAVDEVITPHRIETSTFGRRDIWVATHWWTAHAIDVACRSGVIDRADVLYLVQDYEPGFMGWSTDFAVAASTYSAGFLPVVNSKPLAAYLRNHAPALGTLNHVFGPALDLAELEVARAARRPSSAPRIFFYGRPSKPRNLFGLGVAALHSAATKLHGMGVDFSVVMAGEDGPSIDLGPTTLLNLGALPRAGYFDLLARVDIGVSLQYSPHPSHIPFDLALSGAQAVTNEFAATRALLHPRLHVVPAEVQAIADIIVDLATGRAGSTGDAQPDLGDPLTDVIDGVVVELMRRRGDAGAATLSSDGR